MRDLKQAEIQTVVGANASPVLVGWVPTNYTWLGTAAGAPAVRIPGMIPGPMPVPLFPRFLSQPFPAPGIGGDRSEC